MCFLITRFMLPELLAHSHVNVPEPRVGVLSMAPLLGAWFPAVFLLRPLWDVEFSCLPNPFCLLMDMSGEVPLVFSGLQMCHHPHNQLARVSHSCPSSCMPALSLCSCVSIIACSHHWQSTTWSFRTLSKPGSNSLLSFAWSPTSPNWN